MIRQLLRNRLSTTSIHQFILGLVVLALLSVCLPVRSDDFQDEDLKAVYLYRFAFLVNWRDMQPADGRYDFCVYGDSSVSRRLQDIANTKPEQVHYHDIKASASSEARCQIIYTPERAEEHIRTLHNRYPNALIVGEGKRFSKAGGMISFIKVNNRVKLLINRKNIQGMPFTLRSQLLSIAVIDGEEEI
ncbi:YfiR family protein [Enterovibrio baiacu]|uniref:YfiR family protein n=1 Tax=Enterovibrio baiacu TaxID=2491023 RepID=UPI0010112FB0|nr:YfiR family protein [Enterovibrio baiacu]MBE1273709.1 YfiR family protein [Enterovibrio baiacu]